ncbi:AP1B1 protein [Thecamonas trahens ATCC 50062]|uniref:AP complex subunit beta n=1 Tax=Thecamonas trahens ATCC 50062 TaxID=461836 RepID=A0A0L0DGK3_THETB|nr:AP1B1 protein [Thecamonas trahens ATCC 50062]KNC51464.1 AP1B1 protein [Thecamonas trahens ATCC 50062]|eukprot:XP_013756126.1 AP1B1 protein [Thecamonas trahens ATCC 50062]
MNYAKTEPEKAILAVSTFTRDAASHNPLIRALAIRTMSCIQVHEIVQYLSDPLRAALGDVDPYVRKTAAVCVAKLYDIDAELAVDQGFVEALVDLVSDPNAAVVSNAVAALADISDSAPEPVFQITAARLRHMLAALTEANEWGQVFLLDSLVRFVPPDTNTAERVVERATPHLQHANPAVVLSAVNVVLHFVKYMGNQNTIQASMMKLSAPLCSLVSAEPEIAYVALRSMMLIAEAHPLLLRNEVPRFFVRYDDPPYVKTLKVDLLARLTSSRNAEAVLSELSSYMVDIDAVLIKHAVRAVKSLAIRLPDVAALGVKALFTAIQVSQRNESHMSHLLVEETAIALQDILRRYPDDFEVAAVKVLELADSIASPEALAALVWILGEHAHLADAAAEMLDEWLDDWEAHPTCVRDALVPAVVKCYLKKPNDAQQLVTRLLDLATNDPRDPDIRDRAYMYWRLLSSKPDAARLLIFDRPRISSDEAAIEPGLLSHLLSQISQLSSVYHRPFDALTAAPNARNDRAASPEPSPVAADGPAQDQPAAPAPAPASAPAPAPAAAPAAAPAGGSLIDLMSSTPTPEPAPASAVPASLLDLVAPAASPSPSAPSSSSGSLLMDGLLGGPANGSSSSAVSSVAGPTARVLESAAGKGLQIDAGFVRNGNSVGLVLELANRSMVAMNQFAVQFNKNTFSLAPTVALGTLVQSIPTGGSTTVTLPLSHATKPQSYEGTPLDALQVAIQTNAGVVYFQVAVPLFVFFDGSTIERGVFLQGWRNMEALETVREVPGLSVGDFDSLATSQFNVHLIASRVSDDGTRIAFFCASIGEAPFLSEVRVTSTSTHVSVRTPAATLVDMFIASLAHVLTAAA